MKKTKDKKKLKVYNLELNNNEGVFKNSYVDTPAIEADFIFFNSHSNNSEDVDTINELKFSTENEKRIVTGPVLIPNKLIYRKIKSNEFFVKISEDEIEKVSQKFFSDKLLDKTSYQHEYDLQENASNVIESWIIENPEIDKSKALGFNNLPKGTWMMSYKINDDILWGKIKSGEVRGFSIEGYLDLKDTNEVVDIELKSNYNKNNKLNKMKNLFEKFKELFTEFEKVEKDDATDPIELVGYILNDGKKIEVDENTNVAYYITDVGTRGGILEPGTYNAEGGFIIIVGQDGVAEVTEPAQDETAEGVNDDTEDETTVEDEQVQEGPVALPEGVTVNEMGEVILPDGVEILVDGVYKYNDTTLIKVKEGKVIEVHKVGEFMPEFLQLNKNEVTKFTSYKNMVSELEGKVETLKNKEKQLKDLIKELENKPAASEISVNKVVDEMELKKANDKKTTKILQRYLDTVK